MKKNAPYHEVRKITDIRDMIRGSVELYGDTPAFLWKNGTPDYKPISYKEFYEEVKALGTALYSMGFKDTRIAVSGPNSYRWALSYMTVACGLGTVVPIDKEINKEEFENIVKISETTLVLYDKKIAEKVADVPVEKICFDDIPEYIEKGKKLLADGNEDYLNVEIDPEKLASLIFTSGTTGVSKGVMLSQKNIAINLMGMCEMFYIGGDTFLSILPLHHVYECTCGFLCPLYRGCTIAYCEGIKHITKNMAEAKVSLMLTVPMVLELMWKRLWATAEKSGQAKKLRTGLKISNALRKIGIDKRKKLFKAIHDSFGGHLRVLIAGGAAANPEVMKGFNDLGFLTVQGYGLSECAPIAALNRNMYFKHDSAGLPLRDCTLDIVNVKDDGTGDIRYKGGNVMMGYYENPEATAEVLPGDGWFYTGDIGYLDKDGFLHITGRKKNVIVTSNGKNIFPEELEAYLARTPYVQESVVIGIMNNNKKDYDVIAGIMPNEDKFKEDFGDAVTDELIEKKLQEAVNYVNDQVQNYKHIDIMIVRKEGFPKNTSQKIKRYGLEELLMEDYKKKVIR